MAKRLFILGFLALVVASIYLLHLESPIDLDRRLLALAVVWLGSVPTFVYLLDANRPPIPFFPLVGIFYTSNFGLPILLANAQGDEIEGVFKVTSVSSSSLWLTVIGLVCLLVTFYVGRWLLWSRSKGIRLSTAWMAPSFKPLLWLGLILYFGYRVMPFLRAIPTLGHLINPLLYLGFGAFFFLQKEHRLTTVESVVLWGVLLPLEMLLRFASGLIAEGLTFGLFFCLISFRAAPKIAAGMLIFCFASFAVLNPIKTQFRLISWYAFSDTGGIGMVYAKCVLLIQLAYDYHLGSSAYVNPMIQKQDLLTAVTNRMSNVTLLSMVVHDTPDYVPYWDGDTYLPLFTKLIPRALWPNKPIENTGSEFGHRYFLLDDDDEVTSINMPWLVEMYANFGSWGIYVGMSLAGLLLSWLDRMFNRAGCSSIELIVGGAVLLQVVYQEASFTLSAGDAIMMFIILRLVLLILPHSSAQRTA